MTSKKGSPAKESPIRTQADFERYLNNADAGEAEAQYEIARLYGTGSQQLGIAADPAQSLYWVRCAAEQQYAEAFNFLGLIYTHGDGVEPSDEKAYQYYAQAAQLGSPYAMSNLAWAFFTGTGTEIDYKEALKWAKKAEESEIENAKLLLANLYYHGLGTRKNYKKAFALFLPFAQQGDGLSQYYIAQCYLLGQGVELSDAEAAMVYQSRPARCAGGTDTVGHDVGIGERAGAQYRCRRALVGQSRGKGRIHSRADALLLLRQ